MSSIIRGERPYGCQYRAREIGYLPKIEGVSETESAMIIKYARVLLKEAVIF